MKLLQLNVTANWGSTGKIAEGIGQAAMEQGWESAIAYGRSMNPSQSMLYKANGKFDVYYHYAVNKLLDCEGKGSRFATKNLIKFIEDYKPDIIHLHNIHDHWINYPILFDYLASIDTPIVWTFHDCWAFTGGCAYFEKSDCKKWQKGCSNCPQKNNLIDNSFRNHNDKIKWFNKIGDRLTVVSVSEWLDNLVSESLIHPSRQEVIYNGVDVNALTPMKYDQRFDFVGKKIVLGVANVWTPSKGLQSYIQLRKFLGEEYLIVLVGLDEKTTKGLPSGIFGISRTQNLNDLAQLYSRADVLLSLSIQETFGMTLAEAFACGTPAIAFDTTALPEVISPETGIVVPKGDLGSVVEAIRVICSSKDRFNSEGCRKRAIMNFNKDVQFNKYVDLYDSILRNYNS